MNTSQLQTICNYLNADMDSYLKATNQWKLDPGKLEAAIAESNAQLVRHQNTGNLTINTGVDESEQISSHQNATLSSNLEGFAVSIAVYPRYPNTLTSQESIKQYLFEALSPIRYDNWTIQVQIGLDTDAEEAQSNQAES